MQQSASIAGIQPDVFWKLTYRDLLNYLDGYEKKNRDDWERARLQAYMIYAANVESKDRLSITEWLPLKGDPKPKGKKLMNKKQWEYMKKNWN